MTPAPPASPGPSRLALVAAFAAIYLIWGATFLAIRYAVAEVPPMLTIGIRCAGGAAILTAWCAVRGELARPSAAQWRTAVSAALLLFLACHGLLAWAERRVSSGHAALVMTSIPLWLVFLEALKTRRVPSRRVVAGLAIGVFGIIVLTSGGAVGPVSPVEYAGLLIGGLCWAAGSLVARHGARPDSAIQSTAMQLGAGAVAVGAASVLLGELPGWSPGSVTPRAVGALAFLVVGGTSVAFAAYTWLMRVSTPAAVGTYAFVNPVVAVLLAWIVGDEPASYRTAVAAALVVGAVLLTRTPQRRRSLVNSLGE